MTEREGSRVLNVKALARVEGEGALYVSVEGDEVVKAHLNIYEPPRFFEAFLRGRSYTEPPDITARICGICPVAYQMSSCLAIEDACGVSVPEPISALRRLLYCGEWIESHALHVYFLHAPDFLGYDGAIEMAKDHRSVVERALQLKKIGNELLEAVGGRAIHPVNVRVGGFYRLPDRDRLRALRPELEWARDAAIATTQLVAGFDFPNFEGDWDLVALADTGDYPIMGTRVKALSGRLDIDVSEYTDHLTEIHVERSNALHGHWAVDDFAVGPLARFSISRDMLPPAARAAADSAGLGATCRNPFQSIVVRSVELVAACEEALRIIDEYVAPDSPSIPVEPRAGVGHGISEAPRGLLYHRYEIADDGSIVSATIVPPTAQNQPAIEQDLMRVVAGNLLMSDAELTHRCEQAIRNYDPCISCATHFLNLHIERR